jgi:xylitol oxidase
VPGSWHERLVHFRADATPSAGDELQSEYFVARADAPGALRALRALAPQLAPLTLVSEVRSVAPDDLWMSPAFARASVAIHFTWRRDLPAVMAVLPAVEAALAPFDPRAHWAKLAIDRGRFPRLDDWIVARDRFDPTGTFRNRFVDELARAPRR